MIVLRKALIAAGATSVDAIVTHALFPPELMARLHQVRHPLRSLDHTACRIPPTRSHSINFCRTPCSRNLLQPVPEKPP